MALPSDFPPLARLADELLPDGLEAFIEERREGGTSWDRIARHLWVATNQRVEANGVTVKGWWDRIIDDDPAPTKASA